MKNKKFGINIKQLLEKGLFHIMGTTVINNVLSFISNLLVLRFLSKADYGVFSFALNIVTFLTLISGLGIANGLLQFGSEEQNETERARYFRFSFRWGLAFNALIAIVLLLFACWGPVSIEASRPYIALYMGYPLFNLAYQLITIVLRVELKNRQYALLLNVNSVLYCALSLLGAWRYGVTGLIIGRYIAYIFSILFGLLLIREDIQKIRRGLPLAKQEKKGLLRYSAITAASNSVSQLLYLLDVQLIGAFIPSATVIASYKAATQIPTALTFIPTSVIVFVYPYFARHREDRNWLISESRKLFKIMIAVNALVSALLFIFAPLVIRIFLSQKYADSLLVFRILAVNYFISASFRIMAGNILSMLRKVKVNLYISIVSGAANVMLDILLIPMMGSTGAALATVIVVLISSLIACPYLYQYIKKLPQGVLGG